MMDLTAVKTEVLGAVMNTLGRAAKDAAAILATAPTAQKDKALIEAANAIEAATSDIIAANAKDIEAAVQKGQPASFIDRLKLDEGRIKAMANGLREIAALADPVGAEIAAWERPNGLKISRVRTPIGVIGIIYESRPNVTADAGALCLKSGNAAILRGGSESFHSSNAILEALQKGLKAAGLPQAAIQMVPTRDRAAVGEMLKGLSGTVDVIVPRGGRSLVERVQADARVPVFSHLEGMNHIYVEKTAKAELALNVIVNAKMRRTGICGAVETVLIDEEIASAQLPAILDALDEKGCEIRGCEKTLTLWPKAKTASEEDWQTEYLDAILAVKVVSGLDEALSHVKRYSSGHTEAILSEDEVAVARFFTEIDAAIVMHNASTQFADGGEFGMGAEIGIATGKMHARGPVGVEQLTSFKYLVKGEGQVRP